MSTEGISGRYAELDLWPTRDVVDAMLEGQLAAAAAVHAQAGAIAVAGDAAAERLRGGTGRLIYIGAGTSGRLAVLDGVELGPTYDWGEERLVFCLAGGDRALLTSVEGAEDDADAGEDAIRDAGAGPADVAVGVAASGHTPYTVAALRAARSVGTLTIGIASNAGAPLLEAADHPILIDTGPEIVAGSTRMKAGTAQKIALNSLSTAIMLRLGRVHAGLMIDMRLSNRKLRDRAAAMVSRISNVDRSTAADALERSGGRIKLAVLIALGVEPGVAAETLQRAGSNLRDAVANARNT